MKQFGIILIVALCVYGCEKTADRQPVPEWPEVSSEAKPWTRWWWHGSAVTKAGITSELESFQKAGLGGVEITPIFGVRGEEDRFIEYLSTEWMEMLIHTLNEAERLGLGVDMATGTGWPFGGPWVTDDHAAKNMVYKTYALTQGQRLEERIEYQQESLVRAVGTSRSIEEIKNPIASNGNLQELALDQVRFPEALPLEILMAYEDSGASIDLTNLVVKGRLDWVAPKGNWSLYAIFQGWHGKMVERAAPGGEGLVIDHFSQEALQTYLAKFDSAFNGQPIGSLRAFFNDSYEVDDARGQANWTPKLLEAFEAKRGYDLKTYLPALLGQWDEETNQRVLIDYRETIADLLHENFTVTWRNWAEQKGAVIRNQAHGSPANILDLYAEVDIPETEGTDLLKIKFASSAANVTGKPLSSSESATWLNDHFLSTLADIRHNLERYWIGGINHVFYHGTAYSPESDVWPGHLFYAAIHANDRNSWWDDFSQLNTYVGRVQSFLQNSTPDNDVLVYFPIQDRYAEGGHGLLEHFDIRGNFNHSAVKMVGDSLLEQGVSFDFISDLQIRQLEVVNGTIKSGKSGYQTILLPKTTFMPLQTMRKLVAMAEAGAEILVHEKLPESVPGLGDLEKRTAELKSLNQRLESKVQIETSFTTLLANSAVTREQMVNEGLQFNRKRYHNNCMYFVVNRSAHRVDQYVPLAKGTANVYIMDPMTGRGGVAQTKEQSVYLQLDPGESCLLLVASSPFTGEKYGYYKAKDSVTIGDLWQVHFTKGGPTLPQDMQVQTLVSWTEWEAGEAFSGTAAYSTSFSKPKNDAAMYQLDLGAVHQSVKVYLNGERVATLIGPQYNLLIPGEKLLPINELKVEVSNLMANRIRYMDQNGLEYRKFYNVNFPAVKAENRENGLFHADHWQSLPSGLLGPVQVLSLEPKTFNP